MKTMESSTRKAKKPKAPKPRFVVDEAIKLAESILEEAPTRDFIKRPTLAKTVVFRAVFPAELCKEANATSRRGFAGATWTHADLKKKLWKRLKIQVVPWLKYRWAWPLTLESGRPQIIAVKFSANSNDEGSNPAKAAIDMLTCRKLLDANEQKYTKYRIGLIRDDRRSEVDQCHWWEFLPKKHRAFVLIEVRI